MPASHFDQACRFAAKLDPVGFLDWLLGEPVVFQRWLDTRTIPFPGTPDRICDTVACLAGNPGEAPVAVVVEFCTEPDETMFGRKLEYLGRIWREQMPEDSSFPRYRVVGVVVTLTGEGYASQDIRFAGLQTCLNLGDCNLSTKDAAAILDGIAAGSTARCLLPWIPLMRGGADAGIIARWKEVAGAETNVRLRGTYGALAEVFAEAAGWRRLWEDELKEWNMQESQVILEWIAKGEAKGEVKASKHTLLRLLEKKFPPGPPAEVASLIRSTEDKALLDHWFEVALDAASLDEFCRAMHR